MAFSKSFLVLLLVTLTAISVQTRSVIKENDSSLDDKIKSILKDPSSLLDVPKSGDVATKLIERLNITGADKAELWSLLKAPVIKVPTFLNGVRNGPVSKFIKSIILDCVKDILGTINSEATKPAPVIKDKLAESKEKLEKLKENFNKEIEETYKPLLDALNKSKDPNVEEEKDRVNKIIEDAKTKIESLLEFYNGTSEKIDKQVKSEREVINGNIKNFTDLIVKSNCVSVRKSKTAFQACLEPLYCDFTGNLSKSIDKIEDLSKVLTLLANESISYFTDGTKKELEKAKENVKKELEKLATVKPEVDNAEYLKNKSEIAVKEVEKIISGPVSENKAKLNEEKNNVDKIFADVNATQVPLREAIEMYLNKTGPPNEEVNKYVEEKIKVIEDLKNKVKEEINNREKQVQDIENAIQDVNKEYNKENVNEKCKGNAAFKACVDEQYKEQNDKLQPLVDQLNKVNQDPIENVVKNLKEEVKKVLDEATDKANKEAQRLKEEAEEKQKYVNDKKNESNVKIETEVDPLVNETSNIVNNLTSSYDKVPDSLREKLTNIIKENSEDPSKPLTEEEKQTIESYVDEINNKVNEFKKQVKDEENKAKDLENDLKTTANNTGVQSLKDQCSNEWDVVATFKACIDVKIAPLNEKTNKVSAGLNEIIEKLKQNKINTDIDIEKAVKEIEKKVTEEAVMNRVAKDKNDPATSADRINQCLENINKIINDEVTPLIEELFAIPATLKDDANKKVSEAVAVISGAFQVWLDALDFSSLLNPSQAGNYNKTKVSVKQLIEESLGRINSNVQLNFDSFSGFELKVQKLQDALYDKLSQFDAAKLNTTCAPVYSSKANFSKCIDEECSKFRKTVDDISNELTETSTEVTFLFLEAEKNITDTIKEEERKALEQAKKEAMALFKANNVTKESVVNMALGDLGRFNVTPYVQTINDIRNKAVELDKRSVTMNSTGNNMLTRASLMLNLHIYATSQICPKVSIKNETDYAKSLIQASRDKVFPLFPNSSDYTQDQIALANKLNATLNERIALLKPENIEKSCGSKKSDLYAYFACVKLLVKDFENYFVPATKEGRSLAQDALYGLQNKTILLNDWRDDEVSKEIDGLREVLGPIPEQIYNGPCNATKDKVFDFAKLTINNRWAKFGKSLPETEKTVQAAAKEVLSKDYNGIVDIESKLNGSVAFIRDAIVAAQKKNASYVTPAVRDEPDRAIGVGIGKFQKVIDDISKNASNALTESTKLREQGEALYNGITKDSFEKACYRPDQPLPITAAIVCNNNFSYNFEVELQKLQNKLNEMNTVLANINDTAGKKVLQDAADKLAQELLLYSAQYSIKIYNDLNIPIPENLKPYVKTDCLVAVKGGNCIIKF